MRHCCVPKPKTYYKKIIKTCVTKIKYVPKVKKSYHVHVECGVKKTKRRHHHHHC